MPTPKAPGFTFDQPDCDFLDHFHGHVGVNVETDPDDCNITARKNIGAPMDDPGGNRF